MATFLELVDIVIWPIVAIAVVFVVRPIFKELLSGSKVKLSMGGLSIESTLPEIREIISEQIGGSPTQEEKELLVRLSNESVLEYKSGTASEDRKLLRPLRNAGLIMSIPRNAFLADTKAIELTSLGRLYVRALKETA